MKRILSAFLILMSVTAFGAEHEDRITASLIEHDLVIEDFSKIEFRQQTQKSLNFLVESACFALEYYGYPEEAAQYRKEWNEQFAAYLISFQSLDLGDHAPLNQWLADFYKKLRLRFGDGLVKMMHLDDINTLNYAIPVAFHPKGDPKTGDSWDKAEYALHFVPFVSVVTYWGSYAACFYFTKGEPSIRKFCKRIAGILKVGVVNFVAPKLSDYVYNRALGLNPEPLDIDRMQLKAYYDRKFGMVSL